MTVESPPRRCLKAVHVTSVHVPTDTRILHRECVGLVRAGHDVVLIAGHPRNEVMLGVRVVGFERPRNRFLRMTGGVWRAYWLAVKEGPAIFHLHDPELLAIAPLLRARGWPVIYDAHEVLPHQVLMKYWIPRPLRRVAAWCGRLLEVWAGAVCSAVVAATPDIARGYPRDRVVLVQNFPDDVEFGRAAAVPYAARPPIVAYVGSLTEVRGAIEMVSAIALVAPETGATLTLAGEFHPAGLRDQLRRLPGWSRCHAPGRLNRSQVAELLASARVGLHVVHPTDAYLRGFPVKMFEYMAAGMPLVVSDSSLWRQLIGPSDCAIFVDARDPAAIARAIEWLLRQPERAERMGRQGMELVQQEFRWEVQERRLLELYRKLEEVAP